MYDFQIFGFEEVESPKFGEFKVVWLRLPSSSYIFTYLSAASPVKNPSHLPRGHHLFFSVPNFHSSLHTLKVLLFFTIVILISLFLTVFWFAVNENFFSVRAG